MATIRSESLGAPIGAVPLLDLSCLPSAEDWALLESINAYSDASGDFEPEADRFGRFRLSASYDE